MSQKKTPGLPRIAITYFSVNKSPVTFLPYAYQIRNFVCVIL